LNALLRFIKRFEQWSTENKTAGNEDPVFLLKVRLLFYLSIGYFIPGVLYTFYTFHHEEDFRGWLSLPGPIILFSLPFLLRTHLSVPLLVGITNGCLCAIIFIYIFYAGGLNVVAGLWLAVILLNAFFMVGRGWGYFFLLIICFIIGFFYKATYMGAMPGSWPDILLPLSFIVFLLSAFEFVQKTARDAATLRDYQKFMQDVFNTMSAPVFVKDEAFRFYDFNEEFCRFLGLSRAQLLHKTDFDFFPFEQCAEFRRVDAHVLATGHTSVNEELVTLATGKKRVLTTTKNRYINGKGEKFIIGFIADVTPIHEARERLKRVNQTLETQNDSLIEQISYKENLMKEVHHRVKNNLQFVESLLFLQAQQSPAAVQSLLSELRTKIHAITTLHKTLIESETSGQIDIITHLEKIAGELIKFYFRPDFSLQINVIGHSVNVNWNTALLCGLIVNELITNSLKHAFGERKHGKIEVSYLTCENNAILVVRDNGLPTSSDLMIKSKSRGLLLLQAFIKQLRGKLNVISETEGGYSFAIEFDGSVENS
jgi:PAS domain S-box-containing protein